MMLAYEILIPLKSRLLSTVQSQKRVKAITSQKQGNHTIRTVFFITVSKQCHYSSYRNEENRMNHVVSLLLTRNYSKIVLRNVLNKCMGICTVLRYEGG